MSARQDLTKRLMVRTLFLPLAATVCLVGSCGLATPPEPRPSASPRTASLDCGNPIDLKKHVPKSYVIGLNSIAIAPVPKLLPTMQGVNNPPYKYFAKTPLFIRTDRTAKTIQVGPSNDSPVLVTFGQTGLIWTKRFKAPRCSSTVEGAGWLSFPGGFTLDSPMCVHLTVTSRTESEDITVPIGKAC